MPDQHGLLSVVATVSLDDSQNVGPEGRNQRKALQGEETSLSFSTVTQSPAAAAALAHHMPDLKHGELPGTT